MHKHIESMMNRIGFVKSDWDRPDKIAIVLYVKVVCLLEISVDVINYALPVVRLKNTKMLIKRKVELIRNFFRAIIQLLLII